MTKRAEYTGFGQENLRLGAVVLVDKPQGISSHDVIFQLRRIFHTRKIGHAGTLDPMATGLLVCGIERGTKFLAHLHADRKTYLATMRLGAGTTTEDAEGEINAQSTPAQLAAISDEQIHAAIAGLTGKIMQVPSSVSAKKIAGKKAYELVRAGEQVELPPVPVEIFQFDLLKITRTQTAIDLEVRVSCSAGTYIRALARDLAAQLGTFGHLTSLRREQAGAFQLKDAHLLADLAAFAENPAAATPPVLSLDAAALACFPAVEISAHEAAELAKGHWLSPRPELQKKTVYAAKAPNGLVPALISQQGKRLASVFVVRPSTL